MLEYKESPGSAPAGGSWIRSCWWFDYKVITQNETWTPTEYLLLNPFDLVLPVLPPIFVSYLRRTGQYPSSADQECIFICWTVESSTAPELDSLTCAKKQFCHPSSLLPTASNNEWMVMPNKPEQKLSNLNAKDKCFTSFKRFLTLTTERHTALMLIMFSRWCWP